MGIREVQSSEAKTHLLRLLDDVERGETIVITRHGRAIARLVPETDNRREEVRKAIEEMKALRASLPKAGITVDDILQMRHEGHKY
jgi:prevent-host-death family protein